MIDNENVSTQSLMATTVLRLETLIGRVNTVSHQVQKVPTSHVFIYAMLFVNFILNVLIFVMLYVNLFPIRP